MTALKKIANGYNKIEEIIIASLLIIATLCCCYEVAARYIFLSPTKWTEEFIRYMDEWIVFLGISAASKVPRDLINFDLFYKKMSQKARAILDMIIYLIIVVLVAIIFYAACGWESHIYQMGGVSTAMRFPNWIPRMIIPISFCLLTVRYTIHFFIQIGTVVQAFRGPADGQPAN